MFKAPIVLFLLFYSINFQAQDNSSTAFGSFGILNIYESNKTVSLKAFNWSIGYQKSLKNERFRFVPVIHFGNFRSGALAQGPPDGYLSATNFNLGLDYDFKKGKKTSFFVGLGLYVNHSKGYLGPSDSRSFPYVVINGIFSQAYAGINFKLGIRKNLKKIPVGYEIVLFESHASVNHYQFSLFRYRLLINLN